MIRRHFDIFGALQRVSDRNRRRTPVRRYEVVGRWVRMSLKLAFGAAITLQIVQLQVLGATNEASQTVVSNKKATPSVQLRGRVVCLPEAMHQLYDSALPTEHEHIYGFKTDAGKYYTLLRTKFSEALFADQRFREKELLIKGRVFLETQIFEPSVIHSIQNGVVHDIYYYCDICDIQAVAPGPCECCQGPTELTEKPLGE